MASGGRWKPPRWWMTSVSATPTITSAAQLHQRTRRPKMRSTSGAISRMSPRISSWMNGMLTSVNVQRQRHGEQHQRRANAGQHAYSASARARAAAELHCMRVAMPARQPDERVGEHQVDHQRGGQRLEARSAAGPAPGWRWRGNQPRDHHVRHVAAEVEQHRRARAASCAALHAGFHQRHDAPCPDLEATVEPGLGGHGAQVVDHLGEAWFVRARRAAARRRGRCTAAGSRLRGCGRRRISRRAIIESREAGGKLYRLSKSGSQSSRELLDLVEARAAPHAQASCAGRWRSCTGCRTRACRRCARCP